MKKSFITSGSQYFEEMEDYGESNVEKPPHAKKCERCDLSHKTGRKYDKKVSTRVSSGPEVIKLFHAQLS